MPVAPTVVPVGAGPLRITVSTHGAALRTVEVTDRRGAVASVHLHRPDAADDLRPDQDPYLGSTVGRVANRTAGRPVVIDGREVRLTPNEGATHLHGGPDGFSRRAWTVAEHHRQPSGDGMARLSLTSPDGDQGYPGTLLATVTYEVLGRELRITHEARTDRPTVVNLVNHAYWNLEGATDGPPGCRSDVRQHVLRVAADRYVPVDAERIPVDGLHPVDGTPFDLRDGTVLGPAIDATGGLDHSFAVADAEGELRPVAWLHSPRSGRTLEVRTDQVGLQVYDGGGLGRPFAPHGGVCLEAQRHPDVAHRPALSRAGLGPGETYRSRVVLAFDDEG